MKNTLLLFTALIISITGYTQIDTFNINTRTTGVVSSLPNDFINYNNDLYFSAFDEPNGGELRVMKQGNSSPTLISDIQPGKGISITSTHQSIINFGGTIYFTAKDTMFNAELWAYDGSTVTHVAEINPGIGGSGPGYMTLFDEKIFFSAHHDSYGRELWCYDPKEKKAYMIQDINPGTDDGHIFALEPYNSKLYMAANTDTSGMELHVYDPLTKAVTEIQDIRTGKLGGLTRHMLSAGGKLYFIAKGNNTGFELFSYDDTNGVVQVTDLNPGNGDGVSIRDFYKMMIAWNNSLYFEGYDSTTGFSHLCEYNMNTGKITFHPVTTTKSDIVSDYAIYNNKLYFAATDGTNGIELWSYDGTNPPVMAADIATGLSDSRPEDLTVAHGYLYFSADVYPLGRELFRYNDTTVSIEKVHSPISNTKLYPNPAQSVAHLQFSLEKSEMLNVILTDIKGRTVYKSGKTLFSKGEHTVDIPTANLQTGNYIYQLRNNGRSINSGQLIR